MTRWVRVYEVSGAALRPVALHALPPASADPRERIAAAHAARQTRDLVFACGARALRDLSFVEDHDEHERCPECAAALVESP